MADTTRTQAAMREQEDRLENRITSKLEARLIEITTSIRQAIDSSIDQRISETLQRDTRLTRIDFPHFGGDAIHQWIYQCETYFAIDGTPEDVRVKLAIIHFEGKALQCHTTFVQNLPGGNLPGGNLPTWTEFTKILIDRFGEVCDDPMFGLMQL